MICTIAGKELRSMFLSPLAWSVLGVLQAILAWMFMVQVDNFILIQARLVGIEGAPGVTDIVIVPLFSMLGILLLLVMPLITMRLISEERRNKTLVLLLASPISVLDIVLGKFIACLGFVIATLILLVLMILSLAFSTSLDYGQVLAALFGLTLMLAAFIAIGLFISCLTSHPTVAAVITFGALFMLWIINWVGQSQQEGAHILKWFSIVNHQEAFYRGLVNTVDVAYYLLVIGLFLLLAIRRLDAERLQA